MRFSWGFIAWFFIFLFPFAVYLLARSSAGAHHTTPPLLWPLVFFYGLAIVTTMLAFVVARLYFRTIRSARDRESIMRNVFLIPLLPGVAYLALFVVRFVTPGPEVPSQAAAPIKSATHAQQSPAAPRSTSTPAPTGADMSPPTIALVGGAAIDIAQGSFWSDPGASAADAMGTDLTSVIAITGHVNTAIPGLYTLDYSVVDRNGSSATVSRLVHVGAPMIGPSR